MPGLAYDATDFDLLTAVKARLREQITKLEPEGLVMLCDEPVPPDAYFPRGEVCATVALSDGQFDKGKYDCGGANQLTEKKSLIVTVFTRVKVDQPPRSEYAMLDTERGLLARYKPQVLSAILVDDPTADILQPWQPLKNGQPFLRGSIVPDRANGPRQLIAGNDWLGLSIYFDVEFDWDLRTPRPQE